MKQSQRIVKNVLAGGLSVGIGGLIQLAAIGLIAHTVSVSEFGTYSFILAFALFFQLLADSGLTNILVRELATQPEKISEILGAALSLIWLLSIAVALLVLGIVPFLYFNLEVKILTGIMAVATLSMFHCAGYASVLRSQEDNELQAVGYLFHKILFFILIYAGLKTGLALEGVVIAHLIPNVLLWAFYRWVVLRRYAHPDLRLDLRLWRYLLGNSIPIGGATMVRLLAQQVDVMILTWLSDLRTVGLFSGPYRISMALRFIPNTMAIPLYPVYSRLAKCAATKQELHETYDRSVRFFVLIAFPVATLFLVWSDKLIMTMLGMQYRSAVPAMQILGLAFLPFFVSSLFPFLLTAMNQQQFLLKSSALSLALRIILNCLLIPFYGYLGPCLAFLISELLLVIVWMAKLARMGFPLALLEICWRPLLASCCIGGTLFFAKHQSLGWLIPSTVVATLFYPYAVFKLGAFSVSDLRLMKEGIGFLRPLVAKWSQPVSTT
jgi:O-antigen/teichoic acid export membrane protein